MTKQHWKTLNIDMVVEKDDLWQATENAINDKTNNKPTTDSNVGVGLLDDND